MKNTVLTLLISMVMLSCKTEEPVAGISDSEKSKIENAVTTYMTNHFQLVQNYYDTTTNLQGYDKIEMSYKTTSFGSFEKLVIPFDSTLRFKDAKKEIETCITEIPRVDSLIKAGVIETKYSLYNLNFIVNCIEYLSQIKTIKSDRVNWIDSTRSKYTDKTFSVIYKYVEHQKFISSDTLKMENDYTAEFVLNDKFDILWGL